MCGIVGAILKEDNVIDDVLKGLKALEYRGYDSSGISFVSQDDNKLSIIKEIGSISNLEDSLKNSKATSKIAIAHTRWATHGVVSKENAHPHSSSDRITIVHNGIIENYKEIKSKLLQNGYSFVSNTDSEVICHLIDYHMFNRVEVKSQNNNKISITSALQKSCQEFKGSYAILAYDSMEPDIIALASLQSPMVVGKEKNGKGFYIGSDSIVLAENCEEICYLQDYQVATVSSEEMIISDIYGKLLDFKYINIDKDASSISLDGYETYMIKEINEQPIGIYNTINHHLKDADGLLNIEDDFSSIKFIHFIGCGTSYNASLVAKYWFESVVNISCVTELSSEYRYMDVVVPQDTLLIALSQSGETADTIAALKKAEGLGYKKIISICNVENSTITRLSEFSILTKAGIEVSVASTKAFVNQLTALLLLLLKILKDRQFSEIEAKKIIDSLYQLPSLLKEVLRLEDNIAEWGKDFKDVAHTLFLGRNILQAIAKEGALKLCEISYIHSQAFAAGELKHGPLALVDENMPIISMIKNDSLTDKVISNLEEVLARLGHLYVFCEEGVKLDFDSKIKAITLPKCNEYQSPIVFVCALQLLAYSCAKIRGCNVDKPKNLAKSVTVE